MKKFLVLTLLVGLLLTACGDKAQQEESTGTNSKENQTAQTSETEESTDGSLDGIKERGFITLGTSAEYPPYEWHNIDGSKDEIIGVDIEIAKAIAEDLGVELKIKDMQFDGLLPALNANEMDFVIAGMAAKPERMEAVDFSHPYTSQEQLLLVRSEDADKYKSPSDLKGKNIGTQLGSTQEMYAKENFEKEGATVTALPDNNNIVMELKNQTFDAVFMSGIPANKFASMQEGLKVVDRGAPPEDAYAIAVKKGNKSLVDAINKVVDKLNEDGSVKNWEKEYIELTEK